MTSERTPLLWDYANSSSSTNVISKSKETKPVDFHAQFCMLVGVPSTSADLPKGERTKSPPPKSLYGRAIRQLNSQRFTYYATASLSNTLLLTQVVLGAALTGLGASESSHILITVFGALNTIIAGVVAYLKSRGQPMRARMYRDDLERVVDEIENSEIMWLGITRGVHGYDEIDTDEHQVTVRSEVARLTRLFDRAVRNNSLNNPDMYMAGAGFDGNNTALKSRPPNQPLPLPLPIVAGPAPAAAPVIDTPSVPPAVGAVPVATIQDPDESPASAPPKPKREAEAKKEDVKKEEEPKNEEAKDLTKDGGTSKDDPALEDNKSATSSGKEKEKAQEAATKNDSEASAVPASSAASGSINDAPAPAPARPISTFDPDASPASSADVPKKNKRATD